MPDVSKHAWTHRARSAGGTDPTGGVPWAFLHNGGAGQVVTATTELEFTGGSIAGPGGTSVFELDPSDPSGLLIKARGLYMVVCDVYCLVGDMAKVKAIYGHWNRLSAGVSFGDELNPGIGTGQTASGISEVAAGGGVTIPKSRLSHFSVASISESVPTLASDPYRVGVVLQHGTGGNWTLSSITSSMVIVQLDPLESATAIDFTP